MNKKETNCSNCTETSYNKRSGQYASIFNRKRWRNLDREILDNEEHSQLDDDELCNAEHIAEMAENVTHSGEVNG